MHLRAHGQMKQLCFDILPMNFTNRRMHQEHPFWSSQFTLNICSVKSIQRSVQMKSTLQGLSQPHGFRKHEMAFILPQKHVSQITLDIWGSCESTKHNFTGFVMAPALTLVLSCVFCCLLSLLRVCCLYACCVFSCWRLAICAPVPNFTSSATI